MSELDEQIESDLLDMWLLWERGNWYLNDDHPNYDKEHDRRFRDAIVEYITKLIANQVREAVKEEKSIRAKLVTKAHKDGIADGLHMALYGVKDGSKEEKFIRHLLYSENIGNKE